MTGQSEADGGSTSQGVHAISVGCALWGYIAGASSFMHLHGIPVHQTIEIRLLVSDRSTVSIVS